MTTASALSAPSLGWTRFKRLLVRFERKDVYFKGWHSIAFALINLRHVVNSKV